ncbi:hypothetical protein ACQPW3_36415 [Actinosynnema sp. CA-248983]
MSKGTATVYVENSIAGDVNGPVVQGPHFGSAEPSPTNRPFIGIDHGFRPPPVTFTTVDFDPERVSAYYPAEAFEPGDEVVLREYPDAQVFTIICLTDDPASDGGKHYFARTEAGGTVFLDPTKIMAAPTGHAPAFKVGDRVRVVTDEVPGSAPRGSTGTVRDVEHGFVYVRLDHSGVVFPLRAKELAAPADAPSYRRVADFVDLTALPPGAVVVSASSGQVFAKDSAGRWLTPGWSGAYTFEAADEITRGLLVVYVPPLTQH